MAMMLDYRTTQLEKALAEMVNTTLYLTPDNARYFLAPDDLDLTPGDFEVRPIGGKARKVHGAVIAEFEISALEGRRRLEVELGRARRQFRLGVRDWLRHDDSPPEPDRYEASAGLLRDTLGLSSEGGRINVNADKLGGSLLGLLRGLRDILAVAATDDPAQVDAARAHLSALRNDLQTRGFNIHRDIEALPDKLRAWRQAGHDSQQVARSLDKLDQVIQQLSSRSEAPAENPPADTPAAAQSIEGLSLEEIFGAPNYPDIIAAVEDLLRDIEERKQQSMPNLLDILTRFFKDDGWNFSQVEDATILRLGFQGKNGSWVCYAQAREEQQQFVFYSVCPLTTPESKEADMMEFLTRANYGLIIGNFELSLEDGEIRYKAGLDVEDAELTAPLIKPVVYANVLTMDRYLPGILAVISGNMTPDEAIARIEE
jgi:hypothetical protein